MITIGNQKSKITNRQCPISLRALSRPSLLAPLPAVSPWSCHRASSSQARHAQLRIRPPTVRHDRSTSRRSTLMRTSRHLQCDQYHRRAGRTRLGIVGDQDGRKRNLGSLREPRLALTFSRLATTRRDEVKVVNRTTQPKQWPQAARNRME